MPVVLALLARTAGGVDFSAGTQAGFTWMGATEKYIPVYVVQVAANCRGGWSLDMAVSQLTDKPEEERPKPLSKAGNEAVCRKMAFLKG